MSSYALFERDLREVVRRNNRHIQFPLQTLIAVDVLRQQLMLYEGTCLVAVYPVSTAVNGTGCKADTGQTPTGWHIVSRKIGDRQPVGTVFSAREPGKITTSFHDHSADDLITSRIMWLDGLEVGINRGSEVDSYSRYIYIHGTAQEHLIGRAVSHGCIRMCNAHVITLFDKVSEGTPVIIHLDKN